MSLAGLGLYSLAEAARLIGSEAREIRRWIVGYDYSSPAAGGGRLRRHSSPLWSSQYADDAELASRAIGFRDLLELRVVREFVTAGVPLLVVRRCLDTARTLFGGPYPLTTRRFLTDGRTLFMQAVRDDGEQDLLDLRSLQYAFNDIIKPSLYSGIEYEGSTARRWFPETARRAVVLDPAVQFGKPVLVHSAVPTETLFAAYQTEGGGPTAAATVARIYEVPTKDVQAAVRFETELQAA